MANNELSMQFAHRLREALSAAGFNSTRSTSGVSISKLVEITGYSVQICRRYLRGDAMPELSKLASIARELNVSPGWLAFGEEVSVAPCLKDKVILSQELFLYIFIKSTELLNSNLSQEKSAHFILELAQTVSAVKGTDAQSKKIVDIAFASRTYFN